MNLPNKLTLVRIFMIPLIILVYIFPYSQFGFNPGYIMLGYIALPVKNLICCIIFLAASFTDFLDGYIARKNDMVTTFGKFWDPIADKLLTTTVFILLCADGMIPAVPVIMMIARDTVVDAIRMMASEKGRVMAAGLLGKIKTVLQMSTIVLYLLSNIPFELYSLPVNEFLLWFAAFVSVASGVSYFIQASDIIMETK